MLFIITNLCRLHSLHRTIAYFANIFRFWQIFRKCVIATNNYALYGTRNAITIATMKNFKARYSASKGCFITSLVSDKKSYAMYRYDTLDRMKILR